MRRTLPFVFLALAAVVCLAVAAFGEHPHILQDIELVPAGLALGFAAIFFGAK